MVQQGQVFRLKAKGADGEPLWAYRYRLAGRGSARMQVGGFSTRAQAQKALQTKLARLGPGGRAAAITVAEWIEECLQTRTGERVTITKLRWLARRPPLSATCHSPISCRKPSVPGLEPGINGF
jgi:hypothetical protein